MLIRRLKLHIGARYNNIVSALQNIRESFQDSFQLSAWYYCLMTHLDIFESFLLEQSEEDDTLASRKISLQLQMPQCRWSLSNWPRISRIINYINNSDTVRSRLVLTTTFAPKQNYHTQQYFYCISSRSLLDSNFKFLCIVMSCLSKQIQLLLCLKNCMLAKQLSNTYSLHSSDLRQSTRMRTTM